MGTRPRTILSLVGVFSLGIGDALVCLATAALHDSD
jgi:hypothetical protein